MRVDEHNGDSIAYWTSSQCSNGFFFCFVNASGNADYTNASIAWLSASVCFRVRKS